MNSSVIKRKPKKQRHYIAFAVSVVFTWFVYFKYKDTLNAVSNIYANNTQRWLFKYESAVLVMKWFNICCTYKLIVIVLFIFVYNYGNIFKTFILITTTQLALIISSMLKLFFKEGRPFWHLLLLNNNNNHPSTYININTYNNSIPLNTNNTYIYIYIYHNGYGTPDNYTVILCAFLLTTWYIVIKRHRDEFSKLIKCFSFIALLFIYISHSFCDWLMFGNSLSQILLSTCIGCCVFIFMFFVLNVYSNNSSQYFNIMQFPIYYMVLMFIAVVLVFTIYFFSFKNFCGEAEERKFRKVIASVLQQQQQQQHPMLIQSVFDEAYYSFCVFVMNIGVVCANKREFAYLFENNRNNWMQYNFEKDDDNEDDEESLMTKISFNKEIQWNHTNDIKSICRLIILIPLLYLSMLLYVYIDYSRNFLEVVLFKIGLSLNIVAFGLFHGYKQILKYLKLTNTIIFTMIRESI